jgi:tRNA(fMet)-specific endonuclease VapC
MNGNRYLLDTNAIIALLKGDFSLIKLLQDANWLGIFIISIRQQYRLKLPDAIIAAMAKQNSAKLITRDRIFEKITDLLVVNW